ncbi:MAG: hypothetical protein ACFBRM_05930 [Pikeienuella sp.]
MSGILPGLFAMQMQLATAVTLAWLGHWGRPIAGGDVTINYPYGSDFTQDIRPWTNWGFVAVQATKHPQAEQEILQRVASYGSQIGNLLDMVLALADHNPDLDAKMIGKLRALQADIERIKRKHGIENA